MRNQFLSMGALIVLLAGIGTLLIPRIARGEDPKKPCALPEGDERHDVIISLPFERRIDESALDRDGGHQPWRRCAREAAKVELEQLLCWRRREGVADSEEVKTYRVKEMGEDDQDQPTAIVEKDNIEDIWGFRRARAFLYMFKNQGDVWITRKIVIQEQAEEQKDR